MPKNSLSTGIFLLFTLPFLYLAVLFLLGYHFTTDEEGLAKYLAENHLPVEECHKLIYFKILAPPVSEKRIGCVVDYAEITKDPTACERLMPSSYGIDCVGKAMNEVPCWLDAHGSVRWKTGRSTLKECQNSNDLSAEGKQCCQIASVRFINTQNDCGSIQSNSEMHDQCLFELSFKHSDPMNCSAIQDNNIKSACLIDANALKKDSSICMGCTPPVDKIEDIPD